MARPLVTISLAAFATSVVSFLAAGAIFAAGAASGVELGDIFEWNGSRPRCVNELGQAGEEAATREFVWNADGEVRLTGSGELRYRDGAANSVLVRGPAYLLAHIAIDDSRVKYDCNPGRGARDVEAEFTGDGVTKFSVQGSGDMIIENLNEEEAEISITGSGSVRAAGTVGTLSLSIMGSGDADLGELSAREVKVSIAGSGDAIVSPIDSIDASIAGSGDVEMLTTPAEVQSSTMGSGRVIGSDTTN